jgi:hypothetical protein
LATYYLFLISSSIGIEREEIKVNEIYELPVKFDEALFNELSKSLDEIKSRITLNYPMIIDISDLEKSINQTIFDLFSLNPTERILIEDFMNITISLLFDGHKSSALKPISVTENKTYATFLCKELNQYLSIDKSIINASVFDIKKDTPLNIVKISFAKTKKEIDLFGTDLYVQYLSAINKYTISSLAKSIYIQKQIKYYDENTIYIIKPNQKRFWSRSSAINDAKELISEILKMP